MRMLTTTLTAAVAIAVLTSSAAGQGFTVKRNVNAAAPPVIERVIFDKDAGHEHIKLVPDGGATMTFAEDGAIRIHFTGNREGLPEIRWKPGDGLPATFNAHDYNYVIMRCQWSGKQVRTFPTGRTREYSPDNPWFTTMLYDSDGVRTSALNVAVLTGTDAMPHEMVTLKIPMSLFLQTTFNDPTQLEAVVFKMGGSHDYIDRDYTFTIEQIALAN